MTAEAEQTSKTLLHYLLFTSSQCSNNSIVHQFWFSHKLCESLTILSFTICRSKSDKHLNVWTIFIFLFHPPICCQQLTRIVVAHIKIRSLMTQYSNTTIKCSQCSQISISNKSDNITIYPHNSRREEREQTANIIWMFYDAKRKRKPNIKSSYWTLNIKHFPNIQFSV